MKFDFTIPLGDNCNSANGLKIANKRKFKLPFDWLQIQSSKLSTHETYTNLITQFKNNKLNFNNIIKKADGDFTIQLDLCNLWIPHEPINSTINDIKLNYEKYYKKLLKILELGNNNILIVLYNSIHSVNGKNIINHYISYFNSNFPSNKYYFLSVNLGNFNLEDKKMGWTNIYINKSPKWEIQNGKRVWVDTLLEDIVKYFKTINVSNELI